MATVKSTMATVKSTMATVKSTMATVKSTMATVKSTMATVKSTMATVKSTMATVKSTMVVKTCHSSTRLRSSIILVSTTDVQLNTRNRLNTKVAGNINTDTKVLSCILVSRTYFLNR